MPQRPSQIISQQMRLFVTVLITFCGLFIPRPLPARAAALPPEFWTTNGNIRATTTIGNTLYAAGEFSYVGPPTGSLVALNRTSGVADLSFPRVSGTIRVIIADTSGGWFIGGSFTAVDGVPRQGLAHIRAGNELDQAWNPYLERRPYETLSIGTLALDRGTLYVGGTFTAIDEQPISKLAALDATSGALKTAWQPEPFDSIYNTPRIEALVARDGVVYVGGTFTRIGGAERRHIAALDGITGAATPWKSPITSPLSDTSVERLALANGVLYFSGKFETVGGIARENLAALTLGTAAVTSWYPETNTGARLLGASDDAVYISTYGEGADVNTELRATDTSSGSSRWSIVIDRFPEVLTVSGSSVYLGGSFHSVAGQARTYLAALNATTGALQSWKPNTDQTVNALAVRGDTVVAGGDFNSVGGVQRDGLAAFDLQSGALTNWAPRLSPTDNRNGNGVITTDGISIFVAGNFGSVNGQDRRGVAALDPTTGATKPWNIGAQQVSQMVVHRGTVYVVASFFAGVFPRPSVLGAFDAETGAVRPWNPNPISVPGNRQGLIYKLLVRGDTLYVGGLFDQIGGKERANLAAIDLSTPEPQITDWNPGTDGLVQALAVQDNLLYVGGSFRNIGGVPRTALAALDLNRATDSVTNWDAGLTPIATTEGTVLGVEALAATNGAVAVGGPFRLGGPNPRTWFAVLDARTATPTFWSRPLDGRVWSFANREGVLLVGGILFDDTKPAVSLVPLSQRVATDPADAISTISALLGGTIDPGSIAAESYFEITTASGDYSAAQTIAASPSVVSGSNPTQVRASIGQLARETTYFYRLVARSGADTIYGGEQRFTTITLPQTATEAASKITSRSVKLDGRVRAGNGIAGVAFELTTASGNYSTPLRLEATPRPIIGNRTTVISATTGTLEPATTYYYRAVATNLAGSVYGGEGSFTTFARPVYRTEPATDVTLTRAVLHSVVNQGGGYGTMYYEVTETSGDYTRSVQFPTELRTASGAADTPFDELAYLLQPATTYYYRVAGRDMLTNDLYAGNEQSFTTLPGPVDSIPAVTPLSGLVGAPGSAFTFTASGFGSQRTLVVGVDGTKRGLVSTKNDGIATFAILFPPSMPPGSYTITITEADSGSTAMPAARTVRLTVTISTTAPRRESPAGVPVMYATTAVFVPLAAK